MLYLIKLTFNALSPSASSLAQPFCQVVLISKTMKRTSFALQRLLKCLKITVIHNFFLSLYPPPLLAVEIKILFSNWYAAEFGILMCYSFNTNTY